MVERFYHLVAINDRSGLRYRLTTTPETHETCMVLKSKFNQRYPHVRFTIEEA